MARIKYYYDTESCKYERIKVSTWDIILNLLGFFSVSFIISVIIVVLFSTYFESPKEMLLKKENQELKIYYDLLDKELGNLDGMMAALQKRDDNVYRVIFEADPIPESIRQAGTGGSEKYKEILENDLVNEEMIIQAISKVDQRSWRLRGSGRAVSTRSSARCTSRLSLMMRSCRWQEINPNYWQQHQRYSLLPIKS